MGSEFGFKPTTLTTAVPAWVDGVNGWTSPSGVLKGDRVLLIDPSGKSQLIPKKRVSLTPPQTPPPLENPLADLPF